MCVVQWGFSVLWGCSVYHEYHGGYLEYRGVFSTVGDIMSTVGVFSTIGDIMSTVGNVQYHGDIMMHVGDIMSTMGGGGGV